MRLPAPGCTMVMSTGIVSIDLSRGGWGRESVALLVIAAAAWLAALVRGEVHKNVAGIPATCVIGTRLVGTWTPAAWVPLVIGAALWCLMIPRVRSPARAAGSDFLPVVATQSLAIVGASLAISGTAWLRVPGLVLLAAGVALYLRTAARFALRELFFGAGDQWVAGGALAISALACSALDRAYGRVDVLGVASLVLWIAALAWLPALLAGELVNPRAGAMPARWSTVFPLGMYASMTFAVGSATQVGWMHDAAAAWTWLAVAAWAVALARSVRTPPARSLSG